MAPKTRPAQHQHAHVRALVLDEPLHIEHGLNSLERAKRPQRQFPVAHSDNPAPLGTKDRFDDHIASQPVECVEGRLGTLADDRRRNRQTGRFHPHQGEVFVDRTFESLGRIEHADTGRRQSPKRVHAINDLFERAWRHRANNDRVE